MADKSCPTCGRPYAKARRANGKVWPPAHPGEDAPDSAIFAYYKATSCLEDARFLLAHGAQYATAEQEADLLRLIDALECRRSTSADRRRYELISDQIRARRNGTTIDEDGFWRAWRTAGDGRYSAGLLAQIQELSDKVIKLIQRFDDPRARAFGYPSESEVGAVIGGMEGLVAAVDRLIDGGYVPKQPHYRGTLADERTRLQQQAEDDDETEADDESDAKPHCETCGCDLHEDGTCPEGCSQEDDDDADDETETDLGDEGDEDMDTDPQKY